MGFNNPFADRDEDHSDVVVPIEEAFHRRPSSGEKDDKGSSKSSAVGTEVKSNETGSLSSASSGGFSVEQLKDEIECNVAVEGHGTAYDRT